MPKRFALPKRMVSKRIGTLMCTVGILSGYVWVSNSHPSASAHALSSQPTFTTDDHLSGTRVTILPDTSINVSSSQPLNNAENRGSSPWGKPYTGNGTSTDARGSCPGVSAPLVALLPDVNSGRSLSDYPTFWFYVPYDSETISRGVFLLQDQDHNDVITPLEFTVSSTPGLVSVTVPTSEQPLKENEPYHWYFELYCQDNYVSPVYVDGWIEKTSLDQVEPDLNISPSPDPSSDLRLYSLYRQNFIWFDAVDTIIQEWSEMPTEDLANELLSLLQSANVGIEEWPTNVVPTPVLYD